MAEITNINAHKEKQLAKADPKLVALLIGLREHVDHLGKAPEISLVGSTFRAKDLSKKIYTILYDGVEIGYRLHPDTAPDIWTREAMAHFEQPLRTIPDEEKDPIVLAIFEAFLMEGQGEVSMETWQFGNYGRRNKNTHDCIRITQEFSPIVLTMLGSAKTHIKFDESLLLDDLFKRH